MRLMIQWHNPFTGYLGHRTKTAKFAAMLEVCEKTIERARKVLIRRGLIVGYLPGDGRRAGTYAIARSWDEAETAAKLRTRPDAPYFPDLPDRSVPTLPGQRADGNDDAGDQKQDQEAGDAEPTDDQQPAAGTVEAPAAQPPRHPRGRRQRDRPTPGPAPATEVLDGSWDQREDFALQRAEGAPLARAALREAREKQAARDAAIEKHTRANQLNHERTPTTTGAQP